MSMAPAHRTTQNGLENPSRHGPRPVGDAPMDEELIVHALLVGRQNGMNNLQALSELHTINGHSSYQWMEYYLDHRNTIMSRVEQLDKPSQPTPPPPIKTAKKPVFSPISRSASPSRATLARRSRSFKRKRRESRSSSSRSSSPAVLRSTHHPSVSGSDSSPTRTKTPPLAQGRHRKKHRTIHQPIRGRIPNAPSEEPTPPEVERTGRNRFTQEDLNFMIRFFAYHLNGDSTLSRSLICKRLAEKAPYHGKASWINYSSQFPILDKMLKRAAGQNIPASDVDPNLYTGDHSDTQSDCEESSSLSSDFEHRIPWRMGNEGPGLDSTDEETDQLVDNGRGRMFTLTELRVMAKFMATYTSVEWNKMNRTGRWVPLLDKMLGRTATSLASKYSTEDKRLLQLAKKYRRRKRQRAREATDQS